MAAFKDFEILTPRNLQLHATASVIFTATSSAEVVSIELHNAANVSRWAKLYYAATASLGADSGSYERLSETMASGSTIEYKRTPLILQNGESIYAIAQNSSSINVSIIGRVV
jgi:hypothetical protein